MGDIDTAVLDSLKVLDPNRPIREADMQFYLDGTEYRLSEHALIWINTKLRAVDLTDKVPR